MINAFINFRIIGDGLDIPDITAHLQKKPTTVYKKGDIITSRFKSEKTVHTEDCWIYHEEIAKSDNLQQRTSEFLDEFVGYSDYINELSKKFSITIWIALYPEIEQFNIHLSQEIIEKLSKLKSTMDVEVACLQSFYDGSYLTKDKKV